MPRTVGSSGGGSGAAVKMTKKMSNMYGENRKKAPNGITKVFGKSEIASEKILKTVCGCIVSLMNPQGNEWNRLSLKIMKTSLQAEGLLQ